MPSIAKLRNGAVGGNPNTAFYVPPHSAAEQVFVVAVPAHVYPVVLVTRMDIGGRKHDQRRHAGAGGYEFTQARCRG